VENLKIEDIELKESADPCLVSQSTSLLARWLVDHWMKKKRVVFYRRLPKIFQKGQQNETRRRISQTFH